MKKFFMVLALAGVSLSSMAQSETPEMKYSVSTNSFWSNWFIQVGGTFSSFVQNEDHYINLDKGLFDGDRTNFGGAVALGKWFTPGIGLRTKAYIGTGKRAAYNAPFYANYAANQFSKDYKFWNIQEQVMLNLSNLFCGYNETRFWNIGLFGGAGLERDMSDNRYAFAYSAGIFNKWRLGKRVNLHLELAYVMAEPQADGVGYMNNWTISTPAGVAEVGNYAKALSNASGVSGKIKHRDQQFIAELGLTFNLGKATWNKTPDVEAIKALSQSQIDALNAQLADEQSENARLKNMLANKKTATEGQTKTITVKEVVAAPVSVFFNIGKSKIASRKDIQNVKDLVAVAKDNNSKIVVTGYADSKTGSAQFNQALSQKRAEAVANELVKMGVNRDNIEVVAAGGVNTLTPISYNRRATVAIK